MTLSVSLSLSQSRQAARRSAASRHIGLLAVVLFTLAHSPTSAAPHDPRGVTLLVQGAGPLVSSKAGEETWGEYSAGPDGRLAWTGFVGYLARQLGWTVGGVLRPRAEQVLPEHLDALGAAPAERADVFVLASSLPAQTDGLDSRARELASAVGMLRTLTGAPQIRLVAYSAGGVAARIWLQGDLANQPYPPGSVEHLICVATPHLGVAALARPAALVLPRYGPLTPDSPLLSRINGRLKLPADVRFTDLVIQGLGAPLLDTGDSYLPYLRLSRSQADALPPLLRSGHDGIVHALSAQLQLTPAAARYENRTDRPIETVVCLTPARASADLRDVTLHTQALGDPFVWQTLCQILEPPAAGAGGTLEEAADKRRQWTRQIARHLAAVAVQRRQPTGWIREVELVRCEIRDSGPRGLHCGWQARCEITVPRWFGAPDARTWQAAGSFELDWDRFQRPFALRESAIEVGER